MYICGNITQSGYDASFGQTMKNDGPNNENADTTQYTIISFS